MPLQTILTDQWWTLAASFAVPALLLHCVFAHPTKNSIPGPWLARYTNVLRIRTAVSGNQMHHHLSLHKRYGKLVRVGPNCISDSDSRYIPSIYGTGLPKSSFYNVFHAAPGVPTNFSTRDAAEHKVMNSQLGAVFSTSSLRDLEQSYDACTDILVEKFEMLAARGEMVDLEKWLHWYASDVITSLTFSRRLGCLEGECDVDGRNDAIFRRMRILSVVGQVP